MVSETTETTAGIDLSALYIIDNNLAPVMSISYGGCEAQLGAGGNTFHSTLWEQAAAEGITVVIAAGDSGSAGCDVSPELVAQYGLGVSGFASTPFDVAVGGTDFNDSASPQTYWNQTNSTPSQNSAISYIPEMPWNDSCASSGLLTSCTPPPDTTLLSEGADLVAGGGGPSGLYAKPSWQSGTGVPSDGARDIPDLSLFSGDGINASFYVICQMDANATYGGSGNSCDLKSPFMDFQGVGGTSASAQAFAGIMALVNQAHGRQGNANYVLYPLATAANSCVSNAAAVSITSCIFYDIDNATGSSTINSGISVACQGGTSNCSNANSSQYGIMVSGSPAAAAYSTTTGYDLATGLGSVNVANLVTKWKSSFTATTTTLSLSTTPPTTPITQVHGKPINFTINVTSSGTPAGDASLIAQSGSSLSGVTAIGPFTLSGGSAAGTTTMLPGGAYNVTAHYAGNGTFGASDSNAVPVTVSTESSKTEIRLVTFDLNGNITSTNATSASYGSPYVLRMDVTNSSGQFCVSGTTGLISYPCPTGALTVSPAPLDMNPPPGTVAGHYTLNSQGYAEDEPVQLSGGPYSFVATYGGDNSYTGSVSSALPVTITLAPTSTTLTGLPSSGLAGEQITATATLTTQSNGIAPTGTMQLRNNGAPLGSAVVVSGSAGNSGAYATAQAVLTASLPTGNLSISAQYSGDSNYAGSTSAATVVAGTDFGLSANPSPVTISAAGQTGNSTISVTPQNGFAGTVNLSVASGCPTTGATCKLSPSSVTVSGTSAVTSTLTITTTGSGSAPPALQRRVPPSFHSPVGYLWLWAGVLALAMLLGSSAIRRRPAVFLFATALLAVGMWAACGGGGGGGTSPPPTPTPAVSLSATSLTFGSQNLDAASAAQSVTLTNSGTATLSITSIGLAGTNAGDFSQTNTCSNTIAGGNNCSISVKFTPTATGARSASVSIVDNASGSPHTIGLSGTGASSPTPAGTYPVVVKAVSGTDSHSLTVNVTVE